MVRGSKHLRIIREGLNKYRLNREITRNPLISGV